MIGNTKEEKLAKAKKMMLLFGLLSITMTFAGLTSAYIVSKGRPDWTMDFNLPAEFFFSTFILVLSSFTLCIAKNKVWAPAEILLKQKKWRMYNAGYQICKIKIR